MVPDLAEVPPVLLPRHRLLLTTGCTLSYRRAATACRVEGIRQRHKTNSFLARPPIQLTSHCGSGEIAGVLEDGLIPFCVMSESFWIS